MFSCWTLQSFFWASQQPLSTFIHTVSIPMLFRKIFFHNGLIFLEEAPLCYSNPWCFLRARTEAPVSYGLPLRVPPFLLLNLTQPAYPSWTPRKITQIPQVLCTFSKTISEALHDSSSSQLLYSHSAPFLSSNLQFCFSLKSQPWPICHQIQWIHSWTSAPPAALSSSRTTFPFPTPSTADTIIVLRPKSFKQA